MTDPAHGDAAGGDTVASEAAAAEGTAEPVAIPDPPAARAVGRPRPSGLTIVVSAIVVLAVIQVVFGWLIFHATSELRDQTTIANGLNRCLIAAQVGNSGDATGEQNAIKSCLAR